MSIAVVIPHRNDSKNLILCVQSVLEAISSEDSVYIIDDNSDREHKPKAVGLLSDNRVKILLKLKQHGPFVCKNIMIGKLLDKYEYIAFQDSDDTCDKTRFMRQIKKLTDDNASVSFCKYIRVKEQGAKTSNSSSRDCIASMLFKTKDFDRIGYFYALKHGADAEMLERVKGNPSVKVSFVPDVLYYALERNGSLSYGAVSPTNGTLISEDRKSFQEAFLADMHKGKYYAVKGQFELPKYDFPQSMAAIKTKTLAYMATFEKRSGANRQKAVQSIASQVDLLTIYVNNGDLRDVDALNIENIKVIDTKADKGDNQKLNALFCKEDAYIFTVDDDIVLPKNYVQKAIYTIETSVETNSIFGYMGCKYKLESMPEATFSNGSIEKEVTHFNEEQKNYNIVDALGTGLMFFDSIILNCVDKQLVTRLLQIMPYGMCDELIMLIAKNSDLKCITVPREAKQFTSQNTAESIFNRNTGNNNATSMKSIVALFSHILKRSNSSPSEIDALTIGDIKKILDANLYSDIIADIIF